MTYPLLHRTFGVVRTVYEEEIRQLGKAADRESLTLSFPPLPYN